PLPAVVGPWSPGRREHVAPQDPGPDVLEPASREFVFDAGRAALLADHLLERTSRDHPPVQLFAADAERVLGALVGPGAIAVQGDAEGVDADLRHRESFPHDWVASRWGTGRDWLRRRRRLYLLRTSHLTCTAPRSDADGKEKQWQRPRT